MRFNCMAVVLAAAAGIARAAPAADAAEAPSNTLEGRNNFKYSCVPLWLDYTDKTILHAWCYASRGNLQRDFLPLNECLSNQDGKLVAAKNGNYGASCDLASCKLKGSVLSCKCKKFAQEPVDTSIELNDIITNKNGKMRCF